MISPPKPSNPAEYTFIILSSFGFYFNIIYVAKSTVVPPMFTSTTLRHAVLTPILYSTVIISSSFFVYYTYIVLSPKVLSHYTKIFFNSRFTEFISYNFSYILILFSNGSVSTVLDEFSFFIFILNIFSYDKLLFYSYSFTANFYAKISGLQFLYFLNHLSILIASDSLSFIV